MGLADFQPRQRVASFWDMSKKVILEFSRYPVAFIALFAQVFLIIAMFLFAALAFTPPGTEATEESRRLAGIIVYGFVLGFFLNFALWEIGFSIREEQTRGTLESLYLSPASKFGSLVSRVFAVMLFTSAFGAFAILLVAGAVGGLPLENAVLALVVLFFSVSGFLGIAFIFAGITIKLKESAQFLVGGLQFFFMLFSAMFFPFGALRQVSPVIVDGVSRWLPVSYSIDAFRSLLIGLPEGFPELLPLEVELVIIVLFGIFAPLVGYAVYKWIEKSARDEGTLGEY